MCRSQQVNEAVEGLILVLKRNNRSVHSFCSVRCFTHQRVQQAITYLTGFQAEDNCSKTRIKVCWVSSKSDPPWQLKIWLEQSLTAVTVKENFHTELRSADTNKVLKDLPPRPEIPSQGTVRMLGKKRQGYLETTRRE